MQLSYEIRDGIVFITAAGEQNDAEATFAFTRKWLADPDPEHFSYAHSATAALPFIENPHRDTPARLCGV